MGEAPPSIEPNPYAAPAVQEEYRPPPADSPYRYQSARPLAQAISVALGILMAVELLSALHASRAAGAMERVIAGDQAASDFDSIDSITTALAFTVMGLTLATAVLFCFFMPRANRNARALGATPLAFTPGWSAGVFFVPIWSLYKPYRAMKELWQAGETDPRVPWQFAPVSALLPWWWGLFLLDSMVGRLSGNRFDKATTPADYVSAMTLSQVSSALTIAAAVLAILVVRGVERRLAHRHELPRV